MAQVRRQNVKTSVRLAKKGEERSSLCSNACRVEEVDHNLAKGHILVVTRAISARVNQNFDGWPSKELKKAYRTFIGKPIYVNHENYDPTRTRGVLVGSNYHEHGDDKFIECFMDVDGNAFPKLAKEIIDGNIDSVSMGANISSSTCSVCGNRAVDSSDFCTHIANQKGEMVWSEKEGREVPIFENCEGVSFFELSFVFDPADETALTHTVKSANTKVVSEMDMKKLALEPRSIQRFSVYADEVVAPPKIDTMEAYDVCPDCGTEDWDGEICEICGYVSPPAGFDEPDLEKNKEVERRDEVENDPTEGKDAKMRKRTRSLPATRQTPTRPKRAQTEWITLEVCEDCQLAAAGYSSDEVGYDLPTPFENDPDVLQVVPSSEEGFFGTSRCDSCGTNLDGQRYDVEVLIKSAKSARKIRQTPTRSKRVNRTFARDGLWLEDDWSNDSNMVDTSRFSNKRTTQASKQAARRKFESRMRPAMVKSPKNAQKRLANKTEFVDDYGYSYTIKSKGGDWYWFEVVDPEGFHFMDGTTDGANPQKVLDEVMLDVLYQIDREEWRRKRQSNKKHSTQASNLTIRQGKIYDFDAKARGVIRNPKIKTCKNNFEAKRWIAANKSKLTDEGYRRQARRKSGAVKRRRVASSIYYDQAKAWMEYEPNGWVLSDEFGRWFEAAVGALGRDALRLFEEEALGMPFQEWIEGYLETVDDYGNWDTSRFPRPKISKVASLDWKAVQNIIDPSITEWLKDYSPTVWAAITDGTDDGLYAWISFVGNSNGPHGREATLEEAMAAADAALGGVTARRKRVR